MNTNEMLTQMPPQAAAAGATPRGTSRKRAGSSATAGDGTATAAEKIARPNSGLLSDLHTRGVAVVKIPENLLASFDVATFLGGHVEFLDSANARVKVLGGFGAYGHPSSFHHPQLRSFRHQLWQFMTSLLKETYPGKYLQCMADRFSVRLQEKPVSPESWHRDQSIPYDSDDSVVALFGGWVNLDPLTSPSQFFSCVPGSHLESDPGCGFVRLSKEAAAAYKARKELIEVPPGHAILFNEKIVHEIAKYAQQVPESFRLYNKYLLSDRPLNVFGSALFDIIDEQGVFPLHVDASGKLTFPPMYSKMHAISWQPMLASFSETIDPRFRITKRNKSGRETSWVQRFMPSLRSVGIDVFPKYTAEEVDMFRPKLLQ